MLPKEAIRLPGAAPKLIIAAAFIVELVVKGYILREIELTN